MCCSKIVLKTLETFYEKSESFGDISRLLCNSASESYLVRKLDIRNSYSETEKNARIEEQELFNLMEHDFDDNLYYQNLIILSASLSDVIRDKLLGGKELIHKQGIIEIDEDLKEWFYDVNSTLEGFDNMSIIAEPAASSDDQRSTVDIFTLRMLDSLMIKESMKRAKEIVTRAN